MDLGGINWKYVLTRKKITTIFFFYDQRIVIRCSHELESKTEIVLTSWQEIGPGDLT